MNRPPAPADKLYIYYLQGCLPWDAIADGNGFIGNWQEDDFTFLFFWKPARDRVQKTIESHPAITLLDAFEMTYAEWQGNLLSSFGAGGFAIVPAWEADGEATRSAIGKRRILMDPGVVFGSGTHPTTRGCIVALETAFRDMPIASTLDLGTGTGILAIAATLLGSKRTLAVDVNRLAADTAKRNIRLNKLQDRVLSVQGRAESFIDFPADLLVTNIHYDVLEPLIAAKGFLNKKVFVLSGLLRSQARDVDDRLSRLPVKILRKWEHDHIWHTFLGRCDVNPC